MVTKSPAQKKDELDVLGYYEESRTLISKTYDEENVLVIMFNIHKRIYDRVLKGIWLSKENLTFE